ncbi:hypothetical protein LCGC14_2024130, partial [marine sediment metagenome]
VLFCHQSTKTTRVFENRSWQPNSIELKNDKLLKEIFLKSERRNIVLNSATSPSLVTILVLVIDLPSDFPVKPSKN